MKNAFIVACYVFCNFFLSCDKKESPTVSEKIMVGISDVSLGFNEITLKSSNSRSDSPRPLGQVQQVVHNTGADGSHEYEAILYTDQPSQNQKASSSKKSSTTHPLIVNLENNQLYRVLVYKTSDGSLIDQKLFKRGDNVPTSSTYENAKFSLFSNIEYTFVGYMLFGKEAPFQDNNGSFPTLADAKIVGTTLNGASTKVGIDGGDNLLHWTTTTTFTHQRDLHIIFKHLFTGISVTINAPTGGRMWIQNPGSNTDSIARAWPFNNRMTFWLNDGRLTDGSVVEINELGKNLFVTSHSNVPQIVVNPVTFYTGSDVTVNGHISFSNLTLQKSGQTGVKKNIKIEGLQFAPRTNYSLIINLN